MIRILDNPNKKEFVVICKNCFCRFTFEQTDLHHHPSEWDYVWCPNCRKPVTIEQLVEYKRPKPKPILKECYVKGEV